MARVPSTPLTTALWALAAGFAIWTAIRIGGLETGYPAFPLIAFTPYGARLAPIGAAVALLLGARLAAAVMATSAVVLLALLAPRAIPNGPPENAPNGPTLRVLAVNLSQGEAGLSEVQSRAIELHVDVISFAELTPPAANELTASELGQRLPHRIFDTATGSNGTGLMSRHPLRQLPAPGTEGNDRPTVIAEARLPGAAAAEIYSIHPVAPLGSAEVEGLERYLAAIPPADLAGVPRVLAGDFNTTLDHASLREVIASGYVDAADATGRGLDWTWPQRLYPPPVTIDHVITDERAEVLDYETYELPGGDHRMVFASLRLPEQLPP